MRSAPSMIPENRSFKYVHLLRSRPVLSSNLLIRLGDLVLAAGWLSLGYWSIALLW